MEKNKTNIDQHNSEDVDAIRDLLFHLKPEKPSYDLSESVLQKLQKPSQKHNPIWESSYLLVVFSLLFVSFYFFVKPGETDVDHNGLIRGISGQDKLIFGVAGVTALIISTFFIARFRIHKERLMEIKKIPKLNNVQ
ncbi:MAG: hypothetical protein PHD73_07230 [Sediminibacterium sp.]|nr:hypothetical protein [Sediminibacterium sp.]